MPPIPLDIRNALAQIPCLAGVCPDDLHIEVLPGLTNHNYKITLPDEVYILRLPGAGSEQYINRAQEKHNAGIALALDLSPELIYFDSSSGLQLTRFIAGSTLTGTALKNQAVLQQTVKLLRRLHHSGHWFAGEMRLFAKLDEYMALAQTCRDPLIAELNHLRARFEPLRAAFEQDTQALVRCPCHIDPGPANFIMSDNGLYLIDWEYSAMCEPLWDLAVLSLEAGLDNEQDQTMLQYYFADSQILVTDRFLLYKRLLTLLAAAWGMAQLCSGNNSSDFRGFIRARLNDLMQF